MTGLEPGHIVHVKNKQHRCRPVIVVEVWEKSARGVVFRDGWNDRGDGWSNDPFIPPRDLVYWVTIGEAGDKPLVNYHEMQDCPYLGKSYEQRESDRRYAVQVWDFLESEAVNG